MKHPNLTGENYAMNTLGNRFMRPLGGDPRSHEARRSKGGSRER